MAPAMKGVNVKKRMIRYLRSSGIVLGSLLAVSVGSGAVVSAQDAGDVALVGDGTAADVGDDGYLFDIVMGDDGYSGETGDTGDASWEYLTDSGWTTSVDEACLVWFDV